MEAKLKEFRDAHGSAGHATVIGGPFGAAGTSVVAKGSQALPSASSILALMEAAEKLGYVITPEFNGFSELVAVTAATRELLPADPDTWASVLLGSSPQAYLNALHRMIRHVSPILEEEIEAGLEKIRYPTNFVFEFANVCNLACPICPRHYRAIADGLMSIDDAKSVLSDLASVNEEFTFYPYYLGETLIHPDFLELVDFALSFKHLKLNIVSNAVLLDERIAKLLLSRPIKSYHFSLHDCDTALHKGVHPSKAVTSRNVLAFLEQAQQQGKRDDIWVGLSMVPTRLDEPAVESFRAFWQPVVNAVNIYPYLTPERCTSDPVINEAFTGFFLPCSSPWVQPVISVDGAVLPCCWDYEHTMVMGNVFEKSFREIYDGEGFKKLRSATLDKSLESFPTCMSCSKWVDYLPSFRAVKMKEFTFQSNGAYLSYQTDVVDNIMIIDRQAKLQIDGTGRQNLPLHRTGRPQARKGFL